MVFRRNKDFVHSVEHSGLGENPGPDAFWDMPEISTMCMGLSGAMFLVDVGQLGELVAVPLVEAVSIEACAARGNAENGKTVLPGPCFGVLAETEADLAIAVAVFDDEPADEGMGRRLEMMLDGDLNPADDFVSDAGNEGSLIFGTRRERFDPGFDVGCGSLVTELFGEHGDLVCVARLNGTDWKVRILRRGWIVHVHHLRMQASAAVRAMAAF